MTVAGPDTLIGEVVDGRYTVLERIATGGMASVYRAIDTRLDRDVALKVMRPHLASDAGFVARFHREAKAAARLSHPNIVGVYDQGQEAGRIFLAMEYVPGRTLREVIDGEAPLTPRVALDVIDKVLQALAAAHDAGFMHRDVKPENVLIRTDGQVKVADFGLARPVASETATSATNEVMGTLHYISPEQVELTEVTTRSDVYAAGLILFEMLTGRKGVVGDGIPNLLHQHLNVGVPAPSTLIPGLPPSLDSLVRHATAREPADRPADGGEFLAEVRHVRSRLSDAILDQRPAGHDPASTVALTVPREELPGTTQRYAVPEPVAKAPQPLGQRATPFVDRAPDPIRAPRPVAPAPKRRRRGPIAAILVLLIAGAAAGWFYLLGPGATTTVPTLKGLTSAQASSALDTNHLDARVIQAFSEDVATGVVISAKPGTGTQLHRGDVVTLTVSKGPERYTVPKVAGMNKANATAALAAANLEVGTVSDEYNDTVKKGRVISSTPEQGQELKKGAAVALVLSNGPQPIDVPALKGQTLDEASATLDGLGLKLKEGDSVFDTQIEKGKIAAQDPATGTLFKGDTVTVQVSKGPELVTVPDVFLKSEADAVAILNGAGFKVKVDRFLGAPLDQCTGQTPSGGQKAPKGSTVTITIV